MFSDKSKLLPYNVNIGTGMQILLKCNLKKNIKWYMMKLYPFPVQLKREHGKHLKIQNVQPENTGIYVCHGTSHSIQYLSIGAVRVYGELIKHCNGAALLCP